MHNLNWGESGAKWTATLISICYKTPIAARYSGTVLRVSYDASASEQRFALIHKNNVNSTPMYQFGLIDATQTLCTRGQDEPGFVTSIADNVTGKMKSNTFGEALGSPQLGGMWTITNTGAEDSLFIVMPTWFMSSSNHETIDSDVNEGVKVQVDRSSSGVGLYQMASYRTWPTDDDKFRTGQGQLYGFPSKNELQVTPGGFDVPGYPADMSSITYERTRLSPIPTTSQTTSPQTSPTPSKSATPTPVDLRCHRTERFHQGHGSHLQCGGGNHYVGGGRSSCRLSVSDASAYGKWSDVLVVLSYCVISVSLFFSFLLFSLFR